MEVAATMSVLDLKSSKYEILRELVSEKLTTAALEILAVVERTVSGYEEEAAALRRENDRQKKQLEAVLQPRVSLCRIEPATGDGHTGSELLQENTSQTMLKSSVQEVKESQSRLEEETHSEIKDEPMEVKTKNEQESQTSSSSSPEERAESRQNLIEPKEEVEQEGFSKDFSAPDSAHSASDENDKEWKPEKRNEEIRNIKRKRKNLEGSTENVPLSCKVCQALSGSKNMLIKHSWSHVDDPERLCGVCGEHSESPEELRSHLNSHKKRFSCDVCSKAFFKPGLLTDHQRTHSQEKVMCGVCGKGLSSQRALKRHLIVHTVERKYKCSECGQTFKRSFHLSRHKKVHSGVKAFSCSVCGKAFSQKGTMKAHVWIHNGEKPYKCTVCDKDFTQSHSLKRHMKKHHVEEVNK